MIDLKTEVRGFLYKKQGKLACMVCRATKLDKYGALIKQNEAHALKDGQRAMRNARKQEKERVMEIASESQKQAPRLK